MLLFPRSFSNCWHHFWGMGGMSSSNNSNLMNTRVSNRMYRLHINHRFRVNVIMEVDNVTG